MYKFVNIWSCRHTRNEKEHHSPLLQTRKQVLEIIPDTISYVPYIWYIRYCTVLTLANAIEIISQQIIEYFTDLAVRIGVAFVHFSRHPASSNDTLFYFFHNTKYPSDPAVLLLTSS